MLLCTTFIYCLKAKRTLSTCLLLVAYHLLPTPSFVQVLMAALYRTLGILDMWLAWEGASEPHEDTADDLRGSVP